MYHSICDPITAGLHGVMRMPIVGVIALVLLGGVTAYKCYPDSCERDQIKISHNADGQRIAVCVYKHT